MNAQDKNEKTESAEATKLVQRVGDKDAASKQDIKKSPYYHGSLTDALGNRSQKKAGMLPLLKKKMQGLRRRLYQLSPNQGVLKKYHCRILKPVVEDKFLTRY